MAKIFSKAGKVHYGGAFAGYANTDKPASKAVCLEYTINLLLNRLKINRFGKETLSPRLHCPLVIGVIAIR